MNRWRRSIRRQARSSQRSRNPISTPAGSSSWRPIPIFRRRSESPFPMLPAIRTLIARDVAIALRRRADALAALFFFVVTASLFPLALGPQPELLRAIGPGLIWVAALLAAMLSLPRIFTADYQDGALEQMIL